jgi:hypothetical protein
VRFTQAKRTLLTKNKTFADYFAATGGSTPWYTGAIQPSALYDSSSDTTWFAWLSYNGVLQEEHVTTYDHTTKTWSPIVSTGVISSRYDNDHQNPAIVMDDDGYVHLFKGSHPFVFEHWRTSSARNPSSWVRQADVSAASSARAYPHVFNVSGTLYLFTMGPDWNTIQLHIGSVSSGVVTWTGPTDMVNVGGSAGVNGNRAYLSTGVVVGSKIKFVMDISNPDNTFQRGMYRWDYDTSTDAISNQAATTTVAFGSLPVTATQLSSDFLVADNTDNTTFDWGPFFGVDVNGNEILVMWDNVSGVYNIKGYRFAGGVLTGPHVIDTQNKSSTAAVVPKPDGTVDVYYAKNNALGLEDGDLYKVAVDASGNWGTSSLVRASGPSFVLGVPEAISNAHANARLIFSEETSDATKPTGTLKTYVLGDSGLINRSRSLQRDPWPLITSAPTTAFDPSAISSDMNLRGFNLLCSPGLNGVDSYPTSPVTNAAGGSTANGSNGKSAGKWYNEFIIFAYVTPSNASLGIGVGSSGRDLANHTMGGSDNKSVCAFFNDGVYLNNTKVFDFTVLTTLNQVVQGHRIAMASDLDNGFVGFKNVTLDGDWMDSASCDPGAGTTGMVDVTSMTSTLPYLFGACIAFQQDGVVYCGAGGLPILGTVPTGYSVW